MQKTIRVLIVDDSPAFRELLASILQSSADMRVVGMARDGREAVEMAASLKPDVITMDIHMPHMDGFEATRFIMNQNPCPIVMISASIDKSQRDLTFEALQVGALSIIDKPTLFAPADVLDWVVSQIRLMAEVKVIRRWSTGTPTLSPPQVPTARLAPSQVKLQVVAIAASTGGPGLLAKILAELPANFPLPILIVQHITPGFGLGLAEWLNQKTALQVKIAQVNDRPTMGQVLIAPDDHHMTITPLGMVAVNQELPMHGVRPAADYLFKSVAEVYGRKAIGVILTGMGRDGADGLLAMHQSGARTIAQDQATSVVFGMPAVAIELGAAEQVLPGDAVAQAIKQLCGV